jgi:hypothetical protein
VKGNNIMKMRYKKNIIKGYNKILESILKDPFVEATEAMLKRIESLEKQIEDLRKEL